MEIVLENTGLFETDLRTKLRNAIEIQIKELPRDKMYDLHMYFHENLIKDPMKIEKFEVPQEALPKYKQGVVLSTKDKLEAILSFQIQSVTDEIAGYGIAISRSSIIGSPFILLDNLEFTLEEDAKIEDGNENKKGGEKKKDSLKVVAIMPSLTSFSNNLNTFFERLEREREEKLTRAFGEKKLYDKYNSILDKDILYNIYLEFEKEYGDLWLLSQSHDKVLREKFLDIVKVKAGDIVDELEKSKVLQPLEFDYSLLYDIPVFKKTKSNQVKHKYIGHARLLTNGRIIKVESEGNSKTYAIPAEKFKTCFISVGVEDSNSKLLKSIRGLAEQTEECCSEYGYEFEMDLIDKVIAFMDIKKVLKNARRAGM